MTLEEMTARRDALLTAQFRGLRIIGIKGRPVTYAKNVRAAVKG